MFGSDKFRRLRGVVRNAMVWGVAWAGIGFTVNTLANLLGIANPDSFWAATLWLVPRFGLVGAVAGAAFGTFIGYAYRGQRLKEINWVKFGFVAFVLGGLFVPMFFQTMNFLGGDGLVAWKDVLDDGVWASVFAGITAAGSIRIAQNAAEPEVTVDGLLERMEQQSLGSGAIESFDAARVRESQADPLRGL